MSLPQTIRATVSPDTIDKVGRLFNGGPADVINELLQNARRAGATSVDIMLDVQAGQSRLCVSDDGRGIDDPRMLLTLGQSDWTASTRASEDPAGMSVFSMAGAHVEYRSWSRSAGQGWRMVIGPDAWSGRSLLAVEPFDISAGTEVIIDLPTTWGNLDLDRVVATAACHYPLPVRFDGKEQERVDWLQGAVHIETWKGSRIGVFRDAPRSTERERLNFHGLIVPLTLPVVTEVDGGRQWTARIDIGDTPGIRLVLPARKEVVQNDAIEALKQAVRTAILRAVAEAGDHRLAYEDFADARALGIPIGEAAPYLFGWTPDTADFGDSGGSAKKIRTAKMLRVAPLHPTTAHTLARAAALLDEEERPFLVEAERKFEGYLWYDALGAVTDVALRITQNGIEAHIQGEDGSQIEQGHAEAILVELCVATGEETRTMSWPSDVAIVGDDDGWSGMDSVVLVVTPDTEIAPEELLDILRGAAFCPSQDSDSDSWDTQSDAFDREALQCARTLLAGEDAGILGRALDRVNETIRWLVPEGRRLVITVERDQAAACFQDRTPAFAAEEDLRRTLIELTKQGLSDPAAAADVLRRIREAVEARALDRMARGTVDEGGEAAG